MISPHAKLHIERIPLEALQIKGVYEEPLSPARVMFYYHKLVDHPGMYAGLCYAVPSDTHHGMYCVLDGRHKYLASIMANRPDALVVVEDT